MTTLWERFKFAVETDLDAVLSKKEEKNPLALLNRYVKEAEKQTETTGKWLERHTALSRKLENELTEAQTMLEKRTNQLELSVQAGEDELIRFAESEVAAYRSRTETLKESLEESRKEIRMMEQRYEEMKHKVKDMKIRQLQLMGKENATRANVHMDRVLHPEGRGNDFGSLEDMNSYIETLGGKVEEAYDQNVLARRLEALEKTSAQNNEIL